MKKNGIIITVLVGIIALGAGFFGGMQYQKTQTSSRFGQYMMQGGNGQGTQRFGQRMGQNGGRTTGDVVSQDANSITVKMPDGSSKIIVTSGSTQVAKTATGSLSDIKVGDRIVIFGTQNSDGSVTAQNIQLNPAQPGATAPSQPAGK